jgi:hypothetical protein
MSLNHKKYWLDGIFDDDEFVVPKEDLKSQVSEKSLSLTSHVIENSSSSVAENEIIAKWSWKEEMICRDFIYCDNVRCCKRHYYKRRYELRLEAKRLAHRNYMKMDEKESLDRLLLRLKRSGASIIFR